MAFNANRKFFGDTIDPEVRKKLELREKLSMGMEDPLKIYQDL